MTTLILNPRGKDGGRPPARVAGRGEVKTRKLGRLPGESPGTDVRKIMAEAEAVRLLERSLGTHFIFGRLHQEYPPLVLYSSHLFPLPPSVLFCLPVDLQCKSKEMDCYAQYYSNVFDPAFMLVRRTIAAGCRLAEPIPYAFCSTLVQQNRKSLKRQD
jgi:hypothetical protein